MRKIFGVLLVGLLISMVSCTKPDADSYTGTIESIMNGKDGYSATLKDAKGGTFEAVFSIPNMGANYKRWEVGDKLSIKGDTIRFKDSYSVTAKEAVKN